MSKKRFQNMEEVDDYLEKQIKFDDDYKLCIIDIIQEKNTCLVNLINSLQRENEQLQQELREMDKLLKSYRETIKHDAELLADATRNGYLPPLDDFVKE